MVSFQLSNHRMLRTKSRPERLLTKWCLVSSRFAETQFAETGFTETGFAETRFVETQFAEIGFV